MIPRHVSLFFKFITPNQEWLEKGNRNLTQINLAFCTSVEKERAGEGEKRWHTEELRLLCPNLLDGSLCTYAASYVNRRFSAF